MDKLIAFLTNTTTKLVKWYHLRRVGSVFLYFLRTLPLYFYDKSMFPL